jgi:hypothetical protein
MFAIFRDLLEMIEKQIQIKVTCRPFPHFELKGAHFIYLLPTRVMSLSCCCVLLKRVKLVEINFKETSEKVDLRKSDCEVMSHINPHFEDDARKRNI